LAKVRHHKWRCGYLGIPLATNAASEEIILDTPVLDRIILNRVKAHFDQALVVYFFLVRSQTNCVTDWNN
jgi:hypothetical protein